MEEKKFWDMGKEAFKGYMRKNGEGIEHPSRQWLYEYLMNLNAGSLLDVGCGGGIEYEALRSRGSGIDYCGVDYSQDAIDACKELYPDVDFRVGDARELKNFADRSKQVVVVRHCLEHIDRWQDAIAAAWRVASKAVILILWVEPVFPETKVTDKGGDTSYVQFKEQDLVDEIAKYNLTMTQVKLRNVVPDRPVRIDTIFEFKKL